MSPREARVVAQAKLNLRLRILAREASGFHALETIFIRLELGDDVVVRATERGQSLDCRGADLGPAEDNLAYRAAVAFRERVGWPRGFEIAIDKVVPAGGGLGGGSADAGAVLRALNALAPSPVSEARLLELAVRLGSDVPFLTSTAALALAWGRGERLLALPALPQRHVALVVPPFGVPTATAYAWLDASRDDAVPEPSLLALPQLTTWESIASLAANDFESVVAVHHPALPRIAEVLRQHGATVSQMTGSGSTVFGIWERQPDVTVLAPALPGRIILTRTATDVAPVELVAAR